MQDNLDKYTEEKIKEVDEDPEMTDDESFMDESSKIEEEKSPGNEEPVKDDIEITEGTKWYELKPKKSNLGHKAFENINKVHPLRENRRVIIRYSGHFRNYNSNAKYNPYKIEFNLSRQWKDVDEDIQLGLIESLIVRVFKIRNVKTSNMQLYETFMKSLSKYAKKYAHDPELEQSYNRVNEKFFNGMMEKPNLVFASESFTKLGSYEYGTDTIYISTIFQELPLEDQKFLDYVIYHELLHKKHSFNVKNGRHQSHTRAFREDEEKFSEDKDMEAELTKFLRRKKYGILKSRRPIRSLFKLW